MTTSARPSSPGFTREPTGLPAWPLVLVDGGPGCAPLPTALRLSASPRIGRMFVFEVGEREADALAHLGPFEMMVLDGSWSDFIAKLEWATTQPMLDGLPNVVVITISRVWEDLKDWASRRARSSRRARELLAADPDADIEVTSNYWNDAKARWGHMIRLLQSFAGISVLVARGEEVTAFENGQPVRGETVWSIEAEKRTRHNVTANVSIRQPHAPRIVAGPEWLAIPAEGLPCDEDDALESLVFKLLAAGAQVYEPVGAAPGIPVPQAKQTLVAVYTRAKFSKDDAESAAKALWLREMGDLPRDAEVARSDVQRLVALAAAEIAAPTPPAEAPPPAPEAPPAATPADDPAEGDAGAVETPDDADEQTGPAADPVEAARAFAKAHGGDPDAGEGFAYDEDDDTADDIPDDEDESGEGGA